MTVAGDVATRTATRTGCILFTDLVGFTEYNDAVGDELAVGVLDRQRAIVDDVLASSANSRLVKEIGDGLMLWFATATIGIERATVFLETIHDDRRSHGFPLAVRMGMHHGECTVRGSDLVGRTVNVAARVADLAGPGELLVSDEVVAACDAAGPRGCGFRPVGPVTVKGVAEPIWIHRVTVGR